MTYTWTQILDISSQKMVLVFLSLTFYLKWKEISIPSGMCNWKSWAPSYFSISDSEKTKHYTLHILSIRIVNHLGPISIKELNITLITSFPRGILNSGRFENCLKLHSCKKIKIKTKVHSWLLSMHAWSRTPVS